MRIGRSRLSKVVDFGTNRKRVCDFLLVTNSNVALILQRFWDTATYWPKNTCFPTPIHLTPSPEVNSFEFLDACLNWSPWSNRPSVRLPDSSVLRFDSASEWRTPDGRTDGQTFRQYLVQSPVNSKLCWRPVKISLHLHKLWQKRLHRYFYYSEHLLT